MKRDMDLVRAILLYLQGSDESLAAMDIKIQGYSQNLILRTVIVLVDGDFLRFVGYAPRMFPGLELAATVPIEIGWSGHNLIDP